MVLIAAESEPPGFGDRHGRVQVAPFVFLLLAGDRVYRGIAQAHRGQRQEQADIAPAYFRGGDDHAHVVAISIPTSAFAGGIARGCGRHRAVY